jgi:dienelactone hydrolase
MRPVILFLVVSLFSVSQAIAGSYKEQVVKYRDGTTELEGVLVYDAEDDTKRPVVVLFPDWMGPSDVSIEAADKVVEEGYVVFIADVYGKGVRPKSVAEASEQSGKYKNDRTLMRSRAKAALAEASKLTISQADTKKVGAIGFCFGGTVALELARTGAPVLGTVSFHGGLETPDASLAKNIKGSVLALHGADDLLVPDSEVAAFEKEMRDANIDWQLVILGGAAHAFTNRTADALKINGVAYNERADRRSFELMGMFLSEVFADEDEY